jgi:hypothetical protein
MALPQSSKTTSDVLIGRDQQTGYRTHVGSLAFEHLLVLSQPSVSSCVHILDGQWPLLSGNDTDQIRVIASYSRAENVVVGGDSPRLPEFMFGPEPAHRWCYYFEQADLARQAGDWKRVAELGAKATAANLHAEDWAEWTPFLQAYAYLGDEPSFTMTAHRLNGDPYARLQACNILTRMQASGQPFSADIKAQMDSLLCRGG